MFLPWCLFVNSDDASDEPRLAGPELDARLGHQQGVVEFRLRDHERHIYLARFRVQYADFENMQAGVYDGVFQRQGVLTVLAEPVDRNSVRPVRVRAQHGLAPGRAGDVAVGDIDRGPGLPFQRSYFRSRHLRLHQVFQQFIHGASEGVQGLPAFLGEGDSEDGVAIHDPYDAVRPPAMVGAPDDG